jgi:chromosome segregation ATPase
MTHEQLEPILDRISNRLDAIDQKLQAMQASRKKSMEWIGQLSEHVRSLDAFREEVRQTLEPLFGKLETIDELMRILRHATNDVARRVESLEGTHRNKAAG